MAFFEVMKTYNFRLLGTYYNNSEIKGAKVLCILDYDTARLLVDADAIHAAVYRDLPAGTANDARKYSYIKVKLPNDNVAVYGVPWVSETSIEEVESITINIAISNLNTSDVQRVKNALAVNGFTDVVVTVT